MQFNQLRQNFAALSANQQRLVSVGGLILATVAIALLEQTFDSDILTMLYLSLIFVTSVFIAQLLFNTLLTLPAVAQIVIVGVIAIGAPFVLRELEQLNDTALLTQVNRALIFVVLAQGLNIVVGFTGLLDLGYAAFFAIGAYAYGLLTWPKHDIGLSFFLAIWVCMGAAAAFGMIIGTPTLRLRGDYLAIVTLAFGEIIPALVRNLGDFSFSFRPVHYINIIAFLAGLAAIGTFLNLLVGFVVVNREGEAITAQQRLRTLGRVAVLVAVTAIAGAIASDPDVNEASYVIIEELELTGGSQGMTPLDKPNFSLVERTLNLEEDSLKVGVNPTFWYFAIIITAGIVLFAARQLDDSRLGRAWKAIREDETAADFMGVDPIRTKLLAFAIGASFSGLAGAVYASMLGAIFPELFKFQVSIFLLIIVVLSGRGSVWGVLVGGLIISIFDGVFLAQVLPDAFPDSNVESLRWVFFGIGLLVIMILRPQGLFPGKGTVGLSQPRRTAENMGGD